MIMEDPTEDSYERRREQVRRAQKNHRARKANYFKSLEEEVVELRKQNAAFLSIIRRYQGIMNQHGIPQSMYDSEVVSTPQWATVNYIGGTQGIQVTLPAIEPSPQSPVTLQGASNVYAPPLESAVQETDPRVSTSSLPTETIPLHNLDLTQLAIDFILALERPCLSHHKGDKLADCPLASADLEEIGGNGHTNMLSNPIMARSPPSPMASDAQWTVPQGELEALLRFSQSLDLDDGEVTPVQAWQAISQHPKFLALSHGGLEALSRRLGPLVRCYGFGGVMDRDAFEEAMEEAFSGVD